jgi:hypothetical protein
VKCISLWQPWATLVAIGAKSIETRDWPTTYSGRLAIHAAKRWTPEQRDVCWEAHAYAVALKGFADASGEVKLPLGAIVCTCRLVECIQVTSAEQRHYARRNGRGQVTLPPDAPERSFGDYSPGRWAWLLADVEPLPEPVPFKGAQGFFDVPDALLVAGGVRARRPEFPKSLFPEPGRRWS